MRIYNHHSLDLHTLLFTMLERFFIHLEYARFVEAVLVVHVDGNDLDASLVTKVYYETAIVRSADQDAFSRLAKRKRQNVMERGRRRCDLDFGVVDGLVRMKVLVDVCCECRGEERAASSAVSVAESCARDMHLHNSQST